ncbi:MAG: type II toxin-antitoxin system PemK/MazF family toxin [Candidatus Scalindua sp.]
MFYQNLSGQLQNLHQRSKILKHSHFNPFNESKISTVVCIPLTSNLKWTTAPGNVLLKKRVAGLAKDSVANVSQIVALDKISLPRRVAKFLVPTSNRYFMG